MQKRVIILLLVSFVVISANFYLFSVRQSVTGETSAQGTIYITVSSNCGDGACNGGETCSTCASDCGSCLAEEAVVSGGGGGVIRERRDFSVDKAVIKVMTRQGESFRTGIVIENTEDIGQFFNIEMSRSLQELVLISERSFQIKGKEKKEIFLTFVSDNETIPDVYTGNLEIRTPYVMKKIPIIFSIKSKMILFDVSLDIPAAYREVFPGGDILLQITLFNLGGVGKTNVSVDYIIKDFEGDIITNQSEIMEVETQATSSRTLKLPSSIKPGEYAAIAQVRYEGSVGSSSALFRVVEKKPLFLRSPALPILIGGILVLIITLIIVIFVIYERRRLRRVVIMQSREISNIQKKIKNKKVSSQESGRIKQNLRKKLLVLDKARGAGYISRESYIKGRERIKELLKKL